MEEKIKELLKQNNGIITTKQIEEIGISRVHIKQFIESGTIERVKKGIYISRDMLEDEFYIFQLKNKNAIKGGWYRSKRSNRYFELFGTWFAWLL